MKVGLVCLSFLSLVTQRLLTSTLAWLEQRLALENKEGTRAEAAEAMNVLDILWRQSLYSQWTEASSMEFGEFESLSFARNLK